MTDLATAIVEGGEVVGGSAPDLDAPWWSFTKTVLAATALVLVEQGRLTLNEPLRGAAFTLRQLLQHRAGLRDYGELSAYHAAVARRGTPWTYAEFETQLAALPLRPPGAIWAYSNPGYRRVGLEIERASERPLAETIDHLVIRPLGISGARMVTGTEAPLTPGYDAGWVLHGLMAGPISAAALWLDGLLGGRLLSDKGLAEMQRGYALPQFARNGFVEPSYGLGLMQPARPGGVVIRGHTGGGPGSSIAVYGAAGRTVAAFELSEDEAGVETTVGRLLS